MRRLLWAVPLVLLLTLVSPALALIIRLTPLAEVIDTSTFIVTATVEKLDPDRPSMILKLDDRLKGKPGFESMPILLKGDAGAVKRKESAELLKRVAAIFRSLVRSCDTAARYGGEEFTILLTQTSSTGALYFAEKVRERISETCASDGTPITVSIGVATFPENGNNVEEVIHEADAALYRCKRGGRNRVLGAMTVQEQDEAEAEAEAEAEV